MSILQESERRPNSSLSGFEGYNAYDEDLRAYEIFTADNINWDLLSSRALQFYSSAATATWGEQLSGASNIVRVLHIHNTQSTTLVARAPIRSPEGWSATEYSHIRDRMAVEVATMECVAEKTTIPVPQIVDWHSGLDGDGVGSPYILMSKEKGNLLIDTWDTMDDSDRMIILQQIANIYAELNSLRFDNMGSIVQIQDASSQVVRYAIDSDNPVYRESDDLPSFLRALRNCASSVSSRDFWDHCAQGYLDDIIELDFGSDSEEKIHDCAALCLIRSFISILYIGNNDPPFLGGGFPLYHGDFDSQNILVTDRTHVEAVLDWEYSNTGLVTSLADYPSFINNDNPRQQLADTAMTRNRQDQATFNSFLCQAEDTANVPPELRLSHLFTRPQREAFGLIESMLQGGLDILSLRHLYQCIYGDGGPLQPSWPQPANDKAIDGSEDAVCISDKDAGENNTIGKHSDEDALEIAYDTIKKKRTELVGLEEQFQRDTEILSEAKRVLDLDNEITHNPNLSRTAFIALLRDRSTELNGGLYEWVDQQSTTH